MKHGVHKTARHRARGRWVLLSPGGSIGQPPKRNPKKSRKRGRKAQHDCDTSAEMQPEKPKRIRHEGPLTFADKEAPHAD